MNERYEKGLCSSSRLKIVLGLVDLGGKVRGTPSVWVIQQHYSLVGLSDSLLRGRRTDAWRSKGSQNYITHVASVKMKITVFNGTWSSLSLVRRGRTTLRVKLQPRSSS